MKQPWLKFYPADWRADPALRMCGLLARGLWMEMLCLMHDADPQGSLVVNGKVVTDKQLAALAGGAAPSAIAAAVKELEDAGVFSRDPDGTIYSRRMRRDIAKAAKDKANGSTGGNPKLKRGVNPPDKPNDNGGHKAQRPEARGQKPEDSSERPVAYPAPAAGLTTDAEIRAWIGPLVGQEPVACDPDPTPIRVLLDEPGLIPADIENGIRTAVAKSRKRITNWGQFEGWIRGAAKDRLAAIPRPSTGPPKPKSFRSAAREALQEIIDHAAAHEPPRH